MNSCGNENCVNFVRKIYAMKLLIDILLNILLIISLNSELETFFLKKHCSFVKPSHQIEHWTSETFFSKLLEYYVDTIVCYCKKVLHRLIQKAHISIYYVIFWKNMAKSTKFRRSYRSYNFLLHKAKILLNLFLASSVL